MGLLEDMVKLQFGTPMREGLSAIGQEVRETRAQEKMVPIIQEFGNQYSDPTKVPTTQSPSGETVVDVQAIQNQIAASLAKSGKEVSPSLMQTNAYQTALKNITSISDAILAGTKAQAEITKGLSAAQQDRANAARLQADTAEQARETQFLDKEQVIDSPYLPKGFTSYRQALAHSKAETPYISLEEARLRLSASMQDKKKFISEFKTNYLIPALGYDITNVKGLDSYIEKDDYDGLTKAILASGGTQEDYQTVREKIQSAFQKNSEDVQFRRIQTIAGIAGQAEEAYKNYSESQPPGTPLIPRETFIYDYQKKIGDKLGIPLVKKSPMEEMMDAYRAKIATTTVPAHTTPTSSPASEEPSALGKLLYDILPGGVFGKPTTKEKLGWGK